MNARCARCNSGQTLILTDHNGERLCRACVLELYPPEDPPRAEARWALELAFFGLCVCLIVAALAGGCGAKKSTEKDERAAIFSRCDTAVLLARRVDPSAVQIGSFEIWT